jgi:hypothetical protein
MPAKLQDLKHAEERMNFLLWSMANSTLVLLVVMAAALIAGILLAVS